MDLPTEIWELILLNSPNPKTFRCLSHTCKNILEISLGERIQGRMMDLFSIKRDKNEDGLNLTTWMLPNGTLHGPYISFYKNGDLWEEGNYKNGKHHGKWKRFTTGRLLIESSYWENGKRNGKYKIYSVYFGLLECRMGRTLISKGTYKDDKKTGKWTEIDNSGKKIIINYP